MNPDNNFIHKQVITYNYKTSDIGDLELFIPAGFNVEYSIITTASPVITLKTNCILTGFIYYNFNGEEWRKISYIDETLDQRFDLKDNGDKDLQINVILINKLKLNTTKTISSNKSERLFQTETEEKNLYFSRYKINENYKPEVPNNLYLIYTIGLPVLFLVLIILVVIYCVRKKKKEKAAIKKYEEDSKNDISNTKTSSLVKSDNTVLPLNTNNNSSPPLTLQPVTVMNDKGEQQVIYIASSINHKNSGTTKYSDNQSTNLQSDISKNQSTQNYSVFSGYSQAKVDPFSILSKANNNKPHSDIYGNLHYPQPIEEEPNEDYSNSSPFRNNFKLNPNEMVPNEDDIPIYEVDAYNVKDYNPNDKFGG